MQIIKHWDYKFSTLEFLALLLKIATLLLHVMNYSQKFMKLFLFFV